MQAFRFSSLVVFVLGTTACSNDFKGSSANESGGAKAPANSDAARLNKSGNSTPATAGAIDRVSNQALSAQENDSAKAGATCESIAIQNAQSESVIEKARGAVSEALKITPYPAEIVVSVPEFSSGPLSWTLRVGNQASEGVLGGGAAYVFDSGSPNISDLGAGSNIFLPFKNETIEVDTWDKGGGGSNFFSRVHAKTFINRGGGSNFVHASIFDRMMNAVSVEKFDSSTPINSRVTLARLVPIADDGTSNGTFIFSKIGTASKVGSLVLCDSVADLVHVEPGASLVLVNSQIKRLTGGKASLQMKNSRVDLNESGTVIPKQ